MGQVLMLYRTDQSSAFINSPTGRWTNQKLLKFAGSGSELTRVWWTSPKILKNNLISVARLGKFPVFFPIYQRWIIKNLAKIWLNWPNSIRINLSVLLGQTSIFDTRAVSDSGKWFTALNWTRFRVGFWICHIFAALI